MSVIQQQPKRIQVENAICCNAFYLIFLIIIIGLLLGWI